MADQTTESRSTDSKSAVTVPADVPPASKIDAARERLTQAAGRIEERYRQVSSDVRKGAEKASTELRRGAKTAREKSSEAAQQLRQGYGRAREQAQSLSQDLNDYVQEKPGTALLAAAAVGFVVGLLFRRRGGGE